MVMNKYLKSINTEFRTMQLDKDNYIIGTLVQARMDYRRDPEVKEEE